MFLRLGGRQALSHLSDRSCFPVTRIPLEPAHHPSASRDEAFSSQQLLPFLLFLINFLQRFALAQELSADGPKRASRGGGWERAKDGPGGAAPGLRKPCGRSVMPQVLWVKQENAPPARLPGSTGLQSQSTKGTSQLTLKECTYTRTHAHELTPP